VKSNNFKLINLNLIEIHQLLKNQIKKSHKNLLKYLIIKRRNQLENILKEVLVFLFLKDLKLLENLQNNTEKKIILINKRIVIDKIKFKKIKYNQNNN